MKIHLAAELFYVNRQVDIAVLYNRIFLTFHCKYIRKW